MSVESTREVMMRYFDSDHSDGNVMAEDVVFRVMANGQEAHGPADVLGTLNYFYHVAFDAGAEATNHIFGDRQAVWEGYFVGRHIGEFAGVPATGKEVRVPLCVVYDLQDDQIKEARIYFEIPVFLQQVGAVEAT